MARLGVNVDHVATVRQARRTTEPDPVQAAFEAELGGAHGITVHLREDRRHIQDRDVRILRETVRVKLNLEMAATDAMAEFALGLRPDQVTVVPEKREEITTEGGLDVAGALKRIEEVTRRLRDAGLVVSLFVDPETTQLEAAKRAGADAVELHTGRYADAASMDAAERELASLRIATGVGRDLGLVVHAGHGLTYVNVEPVAGIAGVEELNIGHSIVSRALMVGMRRAVADMRALIAGAEAGRSA